MKEKFIMSETIWEIEMNDNSFYVYRNNEIVRVTSTRCKAIEYVLREYAVMGEVNAENI